MLCPSCATDNRPGATRCRRCGSGITRSCPGCGGPIARTEPLCSNCRTQPVPSDGDGNVLEADNADDGIPIEEIDELLTDSLPPEAPGFIGRTQLLGELTSRIESAHTSRRLVLQTITGEAGVGKTRLAAELCRICEADHPLRVLWGTADESSPYAAFLRLLRQRFSIADEDSADRARQRINDEVRQLLSGSRQRELVELLLQFLGYPPDDLVLGEELDPRAENTVQLEARTFLAIRRILAADAQRAPLLIILDDMERAAPETVNLVMYLAAGLDACAVAIVVLGRPVIYTTHPALGGVGDVAVERAALMPLEPAEASAFLKDRLGLGSLDERLAAWAAHQLGGVPRALVELARFLEETGAVIPGTPARLSADTLAGVQMPDSLDQILAARLELLEPSERDLLEKAAAVGEVFWLDALVALVRSTALEVETPNGPSLAEITVAGDRPRPAIEHSLGNLQRRGFVVELPTSTIPGERELRFTYPPWWEVVSQRLSHEHKKRYHRLVAEWLELRPEGRREEAQEEIGRHLEQAGWGDEAALRYRRAGDAARARYFNEKAIRLYESAIACTSPGNVSRRILLWHDLGSVYELRGNVEAALGAFEHMLRLSWVIVSRTKAAVALNKLGRVYRQKGELDLALEYLEKGLALFRQASDHRGIAASLDDLGQTMWLLGRYDEALDRSAAGLESRRKLGDKRSIASSLLSIGNIERHRGLFLPAEACFREALELRQQLRDRHGIAQCQNALGVLALQRGDLHVAKANWEAALDAAVDLGAAQLEALVLIHLGEAARAQGHHEEARVRFEEAITRATEIGERRLLSDAERQLGLVSLHFGDSVQAKQRCGNALRLAESAGIQVLIGRALIALGEVGAVTLFDDTMASTDGAPEHYRRGVEIFRHIRNDAELAWALERYGRFCVERGEVEAGRGLLSESAQLFTRLGLPQGKSVYRVLEDL